MTSAITAERSLIMATSPSKVLLASKPADMNAFDALILPIPVERSDAAGKVRWGDVLATFDADMAQMIEQKAKKADWALKAGRVYSFDLQLDLRLVLWLVKPEEEMFKTLEQARQVLSCLKDQGIETVLVDFRAWQKPAVLVDALQSAMVVSHYEKTKPKN